MPKKIILKNAKGEKLGEIIFSEGKFEVNISSPKEEGKLEELLSSFLKEGIRDLGEVVLTEPIKADDPLFFDEVINQLARRGYVPIKEKK